MASTHDIGIPRLDRRRVVGAQSVRLSSQTRHGLAAVAATLTLILLAGLGLVGAVPGLDPAALLGLR